MIQGKGKVIFKLFLAVVILMSFLVSWAEPARGVGETCTWNGSVSADWSTAGNWSCGHVPGVEDDVVIPLTTQEPIYSAIANLQVATITINKDATLKMHYDEYNLSFNANTWQIDGTLWFYSTSYMRVSLNENTTGGVITVSESGDIDLDSPNGSMQIHKAFNNNGMLESRLDADGVALMGSGTHEGAFNLPALQLAAVDPTASFVFQSGSELNVPRLYVTSGNAYIYGTYNGTGSPSSLTIDSGTILINSTSVTMPSLTTISSGTTLTVNSPISMQKLYLNGTLNNTSTINVTETFSWLNGGFTGVGTTTMVSGTTSTIQNTGGGTIDTQTLTLAGTTNWNSKNITLSNGAEIINNGTFNANATTTMTGGTTESFTNNGSFYKKTADTTTTMNIPFVNKDTVEVVAGSLVFLQGIDNGEDVVIDLGGGTLDIGDELTLESGDSLVGSGTLAADLVNGGTVSPGESPGIITVQGNYTQLETGMLEIQLGGTTPGTGHDQLVVTGDATMQGTLNVTKLPEFIPQLGDTFFIIDHSGENSSGTGDFDTVNLPSLGGGLKMEIDFADPGVTLTVVEGDMTYIYLPLILK